MMRGAFTGSEKIFLDLRSPVERNSGSAKRYFRIRGIHGFEARQHLEIFWFVV